jgi:short-subunit dehydrogenase
MARRSLDGCRVIITGASSGIGRQLALALARRGARLLLSARTRSALEEVATECNRLQGEATFLAGDVTDAVYRDSLVQSAVSQFGGLDVLINNAGISAHNPFSAGDAASSRRIMEVNYFAATELTRRALPELRKGQKPAIVNMGSILGHRGIPFNSEYAASKFALRGWTESLRAELAAEGIDVLLVSPGTTDTEFFDHLIAKRGELPWAKGKAISAADVAEQSVRALERGRREIFPNWRGRLLVIGNRIVPAAVDWAMRRLAGRKPR